MRLLTRTLFLTLLVPAAGCPRADDRPAPSVAPSAEPSRPDPAKVESLGLHNVYRLTDKLYSGSSPDGDEGFRSLKRLGVRTVLSVDGMSPDVTRAHKHGLRYVHIPVGYDGISHDQALRIVKAVRDLPGPVYVHCHHGQHRGPAAAAIAHLSLDRQCSAEAALAEMRRAGTDPRYTGLYAVPKAFSRPTAEELDGVPAGFPEVARVADLAEVMVGIDQQWENMKLIRTADWKVPQGHPDLDPPHEALQLVEHFREAARLRQARQRPEDFRRRLAEAEGAAEQLELVLRLSGKKHAVDGRAAENAYRKAGAACTRCHGKYRDVPQQP
ncbi:MAG TPA: hypothetical protein VG013_21880 [Gemmataceae bacterium]|jgi:protein tyrosine phosphatase (PTP) superfamily phosphohydrolase (DUF442 family)|nr:hypothetical protein [Gemmataceae bacterium]